MHTQSRTQGAAGSGLAWPLWWQLDSRADAGGSRAHCRHHDLKSVQRAPVLLTARIVMMVSGRQASVSSVTPCSESSRRSGFLSPLPFHVPRARWQTSWLCPTSLESHKGQHRRGSRSEEVKSEEWESKWAKRTQHSAKQVPVCTARERLLPGRTSCRRWRGPGPGRPTRFCQPGEGGGRVGDTR